CFRAQATLRESAISTPYKYRRILQAIFDQPRQIKPKMGTDFVFGTEALQEIAASRGFREKEMQANAVYQIIHDELFLDGNARQ
ncbi:hypothetical protein H7D62_016360, partial [Brucella melitensis]|uniref:hypothetical protein n=1 Tax=Brucella melitensis TaxID=29459 RepID=UPI001AA03D56